MAGQITWNKATVEAGTDPWNLVVDNKKALETAGLVFGVATTAERNALAASAPGGVLPIPTLVRNTETGRYESWNGTRWTQVAAYQLGHGQLSGTGPLAATPGWTDLVTITAVSMGGEVTIDFNAIITNPNSGAHQDAAVKVICDGAEVDSFSFTIPLVTGQVNPAFPSQQFFHTPAAGSHTWKLQGNATSALSVYAARASMTVTEKP